MEQFPDNFKPPREVTRYDGKANSALWLENSEMAMMIKNTSKLIMVCYLPMMMKDAARNWIHGLPVNSIHSWYDMRRVFVRNFEGTYKRPATDKDIEDCVQRKNESTRKYLARWAKLVNSLVDVPEEVVCREFIRNCRYRELQDELNQSNPRGVSNLVTIASCYAKSDCIRDDSDNEDGGKSQSDALKNKKRKNEEGGSSLVVAVSKDSGRK
jgi:hypothetical protein